MWQEDGHRQVRVLVSAWVDEGVAPLVTALNQIEDLETVHSCQGGDGAPAYVFFRHRSWEAAKTAALVDRIAVALSAVGVTDLSLDWSGAVPTARISVEEGLLQSAAQVLREIGDYGRP